MTGVVLALSLVFSGSGSGSSGHACQPGFDCRLQPAASGRITYEPAASERITYGPAGSGSDVFGRATGRISSCRARCGCTTRGIAACAIAAGGFAPAEFTAGPGRAGPAVSLARGDRDPWFGSDKLRHFLTAFAVTGYAHAGLRILEVDHDAAVAGGILVSLAAGIGKEIHDVRQGSFFSVKDLVWDVAGTLVGAALTASAR